jgi:hypothetical protein
LILLASYIGDEVMIAVLQRLVVVCVLFLPLGCGGSTSEIGPAETTPEMTEEQKAEMQQGMEESLKHMPKDQQEKYREKMKQNEKSSQ